MTATLTAPTSAAPPMTAAEQFPGAARLLEGIAIPQNPRMPPEIERKLQLADLFLKSGLCPDGYRTKEAVFVALQFGEELGLAPWQAVRSIYVIKGKPSCDVGVLRGVAETNGLLEGFRVVERTDTRCIVRARRPGDATEHEGVFTLEDAKRAGLAGKDNWKGYASDMLFARATSRLLKVACPGVFGGLMTREEAEDAAPEREPAPAWAMTPKAHGEMKAVVAARQVPTDAAKEIVRTATGGRKVEAKDGVPQYTEGEYTMILSALKAWRPAAAAAPEPKQEPAPAAPPIEDRLRALAKSYEADDATMVRAAQAIGKTLATIAEADLENMDNALAALTAADEEAAHG